MGFHAVYVRDEGPPVEGDRVASAAGLSALYDWVERLDPDEFPALTGLPELGAGVPERLLSEIGRALAKRPDRPPRDVAHTLRRLAEICNDAPAGCDCVGITDGEAGPDAAD
jgi:hypothetical protein